MGDPVFSSRYTGQNEGMPSGASFESTVESVGGQSSNTQPRRPSLMRRFTTRLRRSGTGDSAVSIGDFSESTSPTMPTPLALQEDQIEDEPSDQAIEAYFRRNANSSTRLLAMMERMMHRLPVPVEGDYEPPSDQAKGASTIPTTLRAAIRIFPQVKYLSEDLQEFNAAVEVEGVLHNRDMPPNITLDVIFVVDNGYYVTKECLNRAADAVNGGLYHLRRGDRVALYTTHCAHNTVTGNKPEVHFPLRPFSTDSEEIFQDLTASICQYGTQTWEPARPNPSMTDVVLAVAKSLRDDTPKKECTHVILLSPATYVLHDVSKHFPDLYIHRINPAALPYRREPELRDTVCFDSCCKNVFVSNWGSYQSVPRRIKHILEDARSEGPIGELTNLSIDVRTREGCKFIECVGRKDIPHLRLGQVHTIFVRLFVDRNKTQTVNLDSVNPILNSSLNAKGLRQELQNAVALGATKVHIFDVQLYHRNELHAADCWNYTEAPFAIIREQGRLAPPVDTAIEFYKRQYFHQFAHLTTDEAKVEVKSLLATLDVDQDVVRKVVERMAWEIQRQEAIRKYEQDYRQKLPLCPGPIDLEAPHEWLLDLWNKKRSKRHGVTGVGKGMAGLLDSGI
ncbi:hypothetical protein GQ44DRAFT_420547 [Phaeosphaeriaceae sp. PMI808]|nr:hypothetical protein GQ44DRAFT_420547 [Phaeosphaeriaceae sp. PMI808]